MPKNPHADFTPSLEGYTGQGAFRFWCQMALPLTYDDSLSYYELLCKVVKYLNNVITDVSAVEDNVGALADAYTQLQNYVNNYFDELDIEAELRNVLDAMALDGTLDALLSPIVGNQLPGVVDDKIDNVVAQQIDGAVAGQIDGSVAGQLPALVQQSVPGEVTDWLNDNVTPVGSAVVVDSSLTVTDAAADAKVTGDEINALKGQVIKCPLIDYGLTGMVYPVPGQATGRTINGQGVIMASYYATFSDMLAVDKGNTISADYVVDNNGKHIETYVITYSGNTDNDFVDRIKLTNVNGKDISYQIANNISYIRILFIRPTSENVQMTQNDIDVYFNATISGLGIEFNRIKNQTAQNTNDIISTNEKIDTKDNVDLLHVASYVDDKYAYNYNGAAVINSANTAGLFTIDVEKLHDYTVNVKSYITGNLRVIMADDNNAVLNYASGNDALNISWQISDTAKYLYISTLKTRKNDVTVFLVSKDIAIINLLNKDEDIPITDYRMIVSKNLLNGYNKTDNTAFDANGLEVNSTMSCITGFIPVSANTTLVLSRDASASTRALERIRAANFYDENKTYLSTIITSYTGAPESWLENITTPDNCTFVKLNILQNTFDSSYYYMLEIGDTPSAEYEAYWEPYEVPPVKPFLSNKKLSVYGDSLAADGYKGHNTWIDRVGNYYGFETVYNRGEGGSFVTLEDANGNARTSYGYVDSDGYAYMRTAYTSQQSTIPSGYTEIAAGMCGNARVNTIPLDTDILIIEAGVNDWMSTTYVSDAGAELFESSYETMLSKIITRIPHAKIFCCICPYYKTGDNATYSENFNKHRELIKEAAKKYGCTVIDLRSDMGVNVVNVDDYSSDGLHYYLMAGKNRMAETVIGAIDGYINTFVVN